MAKFNLDARVDAKKWNVCVIEMFAVRREEEADLIKHAVEMKFNWPIHSFIHSVKTTAQQNIN